MSKTNIEYDEEITISWQTINADNVMLHPLGSVQPSGQKTYRIKNFKKPSITFELVATNSNIGRHAKSTLSVGNRTYQEMYLHFKKEFESAQAYSKQTTDFDNQYNRQQTEKQRREYDEARKSNQIIESGFRWLLIICVIVMFIYAFLMNSK